MAHAFTSIDGELLHAVEPLGGRRQDLAHPVRGDHERDAFRDARHALPFPAREVGNDDVLAQVKLGLVENPPSARASSAAMVGGAEDDPESGGGERMPTGGTGAGVQVSIHDLAHLVVGYGLQVVVGGTGSG
jgi:hypothetical protein